MHKKSTEEIKLLINNIILDFIPIASISLQQLIVQYGATFDAIGLKS